MATPSCDWTSPAAVRSKAEILYTQTSTETLATDELHGLCQALSTRPSAFPTAVRKSLHGFLMGMLSQYGLPLEQLELAGECLLVLETQVFPPALKSGASSSWHWVSPASQKPQSPLDRGNLPSRLREYAAWLSDPTASKNQPFLGRALTGMITAADFFRECLHPTDDIQPFEKFLISQLEEDTVQSRDSTPRGPRVIRDKAALQVAGAWVRAMYTGPNSTSHVPEPLSRALLDQCLTAIGKPLDNVTPTALQAPLSAPGMASMAEYPASRPTETEHVSLVALRVLQPLLTLQPASLEQSLPALETIADHLLRTPGAHVEVELALLRVLLQHAEAVMAGFDPSRLLKSFLQVSLPASWKYLGICLETFQLIRLHGEEMEAVGPGILSASFPVLMKMVAMFPLALAEDAVDVLPLLISAQDVSLQCSAVLDLPFLAMAIENNLSTRAPAPKTAVAGSLAGVSGIHRGAPGGSKGNVAHQDSDALQQPKAQPSQLWSLVTSLAGSASVDNSQDDRHAEAKAYLEALFACNQSIDLRQCPKRAAPWGEILLEAGAAALDSPRIRFLCERLASEMLNTLFACIIRDAADPVVCSVLKATLQRKQLPFPHSAYAVTVGDMQQELVAAIIQRMPATLGLLRLQIGMCITDAIRCPSQDAGMASRLIWAIGEYMQIGHACDPGTQLDTKQASGPAATLQALLSASQCELLEALEQVVISEIDSSLEGDSQDSQGEAGHRMPGPQPVATKRHEELACLALSSLTKMAARFQPLESRLELLLGKVVVSGTAGELVRRRAVESLGLLREPDIAAAIFSSASDPFTVLVTG